MKWYDVFIGDSLCNAEFYDFFYSLEDVEDRMRFHCLTVDDVWVYDDEECLWLHGEFLYEAFQGANRLKVNWLKEGF